VNFLWPALPLLHGEEMSPRSTVDPLHNLIDCEPISLEDEVTLLDSFWDSFQSFRNAVHGTDTDGTDDEDSEPRAHMPPRRAVPTSRFSSVAPAAQWSGQLDSDADRGEDWPPLRMRRAPNASSQLGISPFSRASSVMAADALSIEPYDEPPAREMVTGRAGDRVMDRVAEMAAERGAERAAERALISWASDGREGRPEGRLAERSAMRLGDFAADRLDVAEAQAVQRTAESGLLFTRSEGSEWSGGFGLQQHASASGGSAHAPRGAGDSAGDSVDGSADDSTGSAGESVIFGSRRGTAGAARVGALAEVISAHDGMQQALATPPALGAGAPHVDRLSETIALMYAHTILDAQPAPNARATSREVAASRIASLTASPRGDQTPRGPKRKTAMTPPMGRSSTLWMTLRDCSGRASDFSSPLNQEGDEKQQLRTRMKKLLAAPRAHTIYPTVKIMYELVQLLPSDMASDGAQNDDEETAQDGGNADEEGDGGAAAQLSAAQTTDEVVSEGGVATAVLAVGAEAVGSSVRRGAASGKAPVAVSTDDAEMCQELAEGLLKLLVFVSGSQPLIKSSKSVSPIDETCLDSFLSSATMRAAYRRRPARRQQASLAASCSFMDMDVGRLPSTVPRSQALPPQASSALTGRRAEDRRASISDYTAAAAAAADVPTDAPMGVVATTALSAAASIVPPGTHAAASAVVGTAAALPFVATAAEAPAPLSPTLEGFPSDSPFMHSVAPPLAELVTNRVEKVSGVLQRSRGARSLTGKPDRDDGPLRNVLQVIYAAVTSRSIGLKLLLLKGSILEQLVPLLSHACDAVYGNAEDADDEKKDLLEPIAEVFQALSAVEEFHEYVDLNCILLRDVLTMLEPTSNIVVREAAAVVLKNIALSDPAREALADQGAVQALVYNVLRMSTGTSPYLREQGARAIGNLAVCDAVEDRIVRDNGVFALMDLLYDTSEQVVDAALRTLSNLASNPTMRAIFIAEGGLETLKQTILTRGEDRFQQSGWIMCSIAVDTELSDYIVEGGALSLLVTFALSSDAQTQEEAAWALASLASRPSNAIMMLQAGIVNVMLGLMKSNSSQVRMQALFCIANLAVHLPAKADMGRVGALEVLIANVIELKDEGTLIQTLRALANLAVSDENRDIMIRKGAFAPIMRLCNHEEEHVRFEMGRFLVNFTHNQGCVSFVLNNGALDATLALLRSPNEALKREALVAAVNLTVCISDLEPEETELLSVSLIAPLIEVLPSDNVTLQEQAAWALANLSTLHENQLRIINLGAIDYLRHLNKSPSNDMHAAAGKVLDNIGQSLTPMSRRALLPAVRNNTPQKEEARRRRGSRLSREGSFMPDVDADDLSSLYD